MKRSSLFILAFLVFISTSTYAQPLESRLQNLIDSFYHAYPRSVGIMVHIEAPAKNVSLSYATGYSDKTTKQPLKADQPVLIASNTKAYVSATILRLVEMKKLRLDQPIESIISRKSRKLLKEDGYALNEITIRHLLSHSSGINDYVNDAYFDSVSKHPHYKWTRDEQINLAMEISKPLAKAGDTFKYADINYLLLSEIIELKTGKPFYQSIRELIDYKKHGLNNTWFTNLEEPASTIPLAHQYWEKHHWDSYDLDPSWDLYGGGGLIATTKDLAMFYQELFEGKIVKDKQVLNEMHKYVLPKEKSVYCLGVRNISMEGLTGYYHGGFWGTDAIYFPELHASVSIFILERDQKEISGTICRRIASMLK